MRIAETKVYEFEELSEEVKERVIEKFREDKSQYLDIDYFYDNCVYQLEELGFINPKVQYSLSYCQGDGLSFAADDYKGLEKLYIERLGQGKDKQKTAKILAENTTFVCNGNTGRYCYSSNDDVDIFIENYTSSINTNMSNINEVVLEVLSDLQDIYMEVCSKLESQGYDEIEYQLSDECIIEDIQYNEYEFTEEGRIF